MRTALRPLAGGSHRSSAAGLTATAMVLAVITLIVTALFVTAQFRRQDEEG